MGGHGRAFRATAITFFLALALPVAGTPVRAAAPPPVGGSVEPSTGPVTGNQWVTVSGQNFQPNAGVGFGGNPPMLAQYINSTTLRIQTPPAPYEYVANVTIVNPDGQSTTYPWGYAYVKGVYTLDGWGGLHPDGGSSAMSGGAYWPGWKIARSAALLPDGTGGYQLDDYGGLHPFGNATPVQAAYFGWDIARDLVILPGATGDAPQGYTLDGWGGIHPFGAAPTVRSSGYWPFWDIAARFALLGDGSGGYVMDGWGGLHPFAVGTSQMPPDIMNAAYWPHWSIARALSLGPDSTYYRVYGVTLDGYGGLHSFSSPGLYVPARMQSFDFPGRDIARAVKLVPGSTNERPMGWTMDGFGGIYSFGFSPNMVPIGGRWPNWDIAVQLLLR